MSDNMEADRISVRVGRKLRSKIRKLAKTSGKRESELIREALEREFRSHTPETDSYAIAMELGLIGSIADAPADLSTNRKHLERFGKQ
jgi:Arc/MetJ-type ribon-helix-helix transcriptional regulator